MESLGLFFSAVKPLEEARRVILQWLLAGSAGGESPKIKGFTVKEMESERQKRRWIWSETHLGQ